MKSRLFRSQRRNSDGFKNRRYNVPCMRCRFCFFLLGTWCDRLRTTRSSARSPKEEEKKEDEGGGGGGGSYDDDDDTDSAPYNLSKSEDVDIETDVDIDG